SGPTARSTTCRPASAITACSAAAAGPARSIPWCETPYWPTNSGLFSVSRRITLSVMADFSKKTLPDWEKLAANELREKPGSALDWTTPEGIAVKPIYTAADLENQETVGSLPGFPPFTRGPKATMYAGRPWTIRQYAGFSTAEESNKFYRAN